ncbi:polyprenal reductase-like isoform X2 [Polyergus mexicanus]|uniref:polyprenal reductase-like isoform X2 n=1 Tax=Polyergus mexicanus TaxID=615972 RepID=UPI0038B4DC07
MDINIIRHVFTSSALFMVLCGLLSKFIHVYLPLTVTDILYSKYVTSKTHNILTNFNVPKRWFRHFYIFSGPASTIILCLILYKFLLNGNISEIIFALLDMLLGASRKSLIPAKNVILAIVILNIQCWKRAYETCYINVFSDQKMNISIYFIGFIHYAGIFLCIIGESEGFIRDSHESVILYKLTTIELICMFIWLWSSYMQLKSNFILAGLRKNQHGDVITKEHKIPFGGLFKYISNPLQFTEIIIYIILSVILWQASTFHYITIWVITNQLECAILSHEWYHATFKNYPKERKILIPYIW